MVLAAIGSFPQSSPASGAPSAAISYLLHAWPYQEYWTGVEFNGAKIGFGHVSVRATDEPGLYRIESEAAFRLHFLGVEKSVSLTMDDWVGSDLSLVRFSYEYELDGHELTLQGEVTEDQLRVEITTRAGSKQQVLQLPDTVYPVSAALMYPTYHGLEVGRQYQYWVYNGELQELTRVTQAIESYETHGSLDKSAFKVQTKMRGNEVTTWVDGAGRPLLELALQGAVVSVLEDEKHAKKYLMLATLNKEDALLDFSLIRIQDAIQNPREVTRLRMDLYELGDLEIPSDTLQRCEKLGQSVSCEINSADLSSFPRSTSADHQATRSYLEPSTTVQSELKSIRSTAQRIAGDRQDPIEQIQAILAWLGENVERKGVDVFSAADVLASRRAECQGHSYLFAALARSLGIPTRVVNGVVYSEAYGGFLYHTWVESQLEEAWLPIDPTFGQVSADATHLKLLEGETWSDLMPLVDIVGRVKIVVNATESSAGE